MNLVFSPQAWEDYQHWVQTDLKLVKRINELIKDAARRNRILFDKLGLHKN